jgi:hypothetical protein
MKAITTVKMVQTYAKNQLVFWQKMFNKMPSAMHWKMTVHFMLVYQQASYLSSPSAATVRDALLKQLDSLPLGAWDEAIVKAMTGFSVAEVIRDAAKDM